MNIDNINISSLTISGSLTVSGSFSYGNLYPQTMSNNIFGTASYTNIALTSSYVNASNIDGLVASSSYSTNAGLLLSKISYATSSTDTFIKHYQALGGKAKIEILGEVDVSSINTAITLTAQQLLLTPCYVFEPQTITGVMWYQTVQGAYVVTTQYNGAALYTYDGAGTINLLASSSNNSDIWKTPSTTWASQSFSFPYTITTEGVYYIGILYDRNTVTTAPQIGGLLGLQAASTTYASPPNATNNAKFYGVQTPITSFPSSIAMSAISVTSIRPYLFLY